MGESDVAALREELAALREMVSRLVMREMERPRLYEFQAAARLLSVDAKTIGRMVASGELMTVQVRAKRLIPAEEIDRVASPVRPPASSGATPGRVRYDAAAASRRLAELRRGR